MKEFARVMVASKHFSAQLSLVILFLYFFYLSIFLEKVYFSDDHDIGCY